MARTGRPREFDRDSAVASAMNLFWEKGFESTSLADLRNTLGLSSASFYSAFGSKQALFHECLERYTHTCGNVTTALEDDTLSPKLAMTRMLHQSIEMQTSPDSPAGCMAVLSGLNCAEDNQVVEQLTREIRTRTRTAIRGCVSRGVDQGELESTCNIDALTLMLDTFVKGISIEVRDGATAEALKASADLLMQQWEAV